MFEPYGSQPAMKPGQGIRTIAVTQPNFVTPEHADLYKQKTVTAAALKLLLDYCESDWGMSLEEYCAGVFHSRAPAEGETAFDLLPSAQERLSADRLGLGAIYGGARGG